MTVSSRSNARRGLRASSVPHSSDDDQTPGHRIRGYILITLGTLFISTVPVVTKVALQDMSPVHFSFFWMLGGLLYTTLAALVQGPVRNAKSVAREWRYLIAAGISAFFWVFLAFSGLQFLKPTVATVIFNVRGVWGILFGLLILKERYTRGEYIGMGIILAGLLVLFVDAGGTDEIKGALMSIGGALAYVVTNSFVKRFVSRSGVIPALFARFTVPMIFFFLLGFAEGIPFDALHGRTLLLILFGAFVGPFLSFVLIYNSLKYLSLGVQTIFQSVGPFFTAFYSYFVFADLPAPLEIAGGIAIVAGILVIGLSSRRKRSVQRHASK